ncbi:HepT-like ribonuclease domain-containing protein, partial [Parabacteroides distasonis]
FDEFSSNKILLFAVIKNLDIIGEESYLITNEFLEEHQEIACNEVIGMLHLLVHGYYQISDEIVWGTIQTDLFPLKDKIERLICK